MKTTSMKILQLLVITAFIGISHVSLAAITTVPDGLNPGDQYRLVFVTAGLRDASSDTINDYNNFVTSQANASADLASLSTAWKVLGSTASVSAITNTGTDPAFAGVPIYNLSGQLVAAGNADLWDGTLTNPINVDQNGDIWAQKVFTGTADDGSPIAGYQLGAIGDRVRYGDSSLTTSYWTNVNWDWAGDLTALHFYGISGTLQVVPEPATMLLLALGALTLKKSKQKNH